MPLASTGVVFVQQLNLQTSGVAQKENQSEMNPSMGARRWSIHMILFELYVDDEWQTNSNKYAFRHER